ncbi:YesL family protein [Paenibacillus polymyxa]|uniref:YesL family protein n=1 Tax=Paenibacillus polymyxa TaxID=1406 RepID=UPI003F84202B
MVRFVENMNKWCMRLLRLVYLNLLWTIATILGLGFIGVGPATVAMLSILRQWIRGNEEVAIFSTFVRYVRESFKEAAIIGGLYSLVGYVLYVDIVNVSSWYVRVVTLIGAFLYLISLAYIFPLLAHYDWKGTRLKVKMSIVIGISYLQYTLVLFVAIVVLFALILGLYPGILTFAGASIMGYLVMWMTHQVFSKIEREVLVKEEDMA